MFGFLLGFLENLCPTTAPPPPYSRSLSEILGNYIYEEVLGKWSYMVVHCLKNSPNWRQSSWRAMPYLPIQNMTEVAMQKKCPTIYSSINSQLLNHHGRPSSFEYRIVDETRKPEIIDTQIRLCNNTRCLSPNMSTLGAMSHMSSFIYFLYMFIY